MTKAVIIQHLIKMAPMLFIVGSSVIAAIACWVTIALVPQADLEELIAEIKAYQR